MELSDESIKAFEATPVGRLWDRPAILLAKDTGAQTANTIKNLFLELSAIESVFSSALVALVDKFDRVPFCEGPSLSAGWHVLLSQIREYGTEFAGLSHSVLQVANGEDLQQARTILGDSIPQLQSNIDVAQKSVVESSEKKKAETSLAATTLAALDSFQSLEYERVRGLREALSEVVSRHGVALQPLVKSALQVGGFGFPSGIV